MDPEFAERPSWGHCQPGFRISVGQICSDLCFQRSDKSKLAPRPRAPAVQARPLIPLPPAMKRLSLQAALPRLRGARLPCLGMLLVAAAAAQDMLSIPVSADGELQPPPGVRLEGTGVIDTLAGTGQEGDSGDGGPAIQAEFSFPRSLALDPTGNIYVVDTRSHRIRRIDAGGVISTFAGTGEDGDDGDGGPAIEAQLCYPAGVAADAAGSVYVADSWNHRVRKIDVEGIITTIAGTGGPHSGGDGGPATEAQLAFPVAVALDAGGNLYVAEGRSHRIRRIDAEGTITTFAGTGVVGYSGDGGPASRARLAYPAGISVDQAGNVFIADSWNHRIRRVISSGVISTVAGTGDRGDGGDGSPAVQAQLAYPVAVAGDTTGNLYVVSFVPGMGNHRIRKIDASRTISAFAGAGGQGYGGDGDPAPAAQLAYPLGVAADAEGNVYIADSRNARVRVVRPGLQVRVALGASGESISLVVGEAGVLERGGQPVLDGSEVTAGNGNSYALTKSSDSVVVATYVPQSQQVRLTGGDVTLARDEDGIWQIDGDPVENGHRHLHQGKEYVLELADGSWRLAEFTIETVAGAPEVAVDGVLATAAFLRAPADVAVDRVGNLYVAEWRGHRIRKIDPSGIVTTLAGTGEWGFGGDGGPAIRAHLNHPSAVAVDASGKVYVAEWEGQRIRRIEPSGVIATIAGTGRWGDEGDGGPAVEAPVSGLDGIAVDSGGTVYGAVDDKIRRIDPSGIITTFAGTGDRGSDGDGGPAAHARLADPHGIAVDMVGNVFVAEKLGHRVRRIDGSGIITTFAGTGDRGSGGDGGPAIEAQFAEPHGIAADTAGNIYVAEALGGRLRRIDASGVITTYAGAGDKWDGDGGPAVEARVEPFGVAADTTGNVYLAEPWRGQVRKIDTAGIITTIAGTGDSATDPGRLHDPRAAAITASGDLFFGDSGSVWKLNVAGEVTRVAGDHVKDHPWLNVEDLAADSVGNLYVAENGNNLVRKVDSAGTVTTFAGTGEPGSSGDGGPATEARLDSAAGVAVDSVGNVYVVEGRGHRVRRINLAGVITTIAGTGNRGPGGDGGLATEAELEHPLAVAVGPAGNVYIADSRGWRIRKVDTSGMINEFADPDIRISQGAFATDGAGRVYAGGGRQIRRIDANGVVSIIAGTGEDGYSGDGGPALSARFSVFGIAVDRSGDIWFADRLSRRIRVLRRQNP